MRLGVDADLVGKNLSGNETYLRGMVSGFSRCLDPEDDGLLLAGSSREHLETIDTGPMRREIVMTASGIVGDLTLGRRLGRAGASAVLATYNAPLLFRGRTATAIHDVAFRRVSETYPLALRARIEASVARSVLVSDLVVTISEFTKRELLDLYPRLDTRRIIVTYCAPQRAFFDVERSRGAVKDVRQRYNLPRDFVLAVGNIQPRKNLGRLADALRDLDIPLVLVGQPGWRSSDLLQNVVTRTQWLGYIPIEHLAAVYAAATVFVYPSLYEGFGLPVVEAMAAGAPVVTSADSSMSEVAGDAAVLVDPASTESIRHGVERVLGDVELGHELRCRGRKRATKFCWERSAAVLHTALMD